MTTPGATEAVTPEQRATEIYETIPLGGSMGQIEMVALLARHLREAEANALRRAAETADAWLSRCTQFPAHYRYHPECARAHDEQIAGTGDAIRSLLPKEAGK